ncbi:hypothetical protein [Leucobacter triazinivorans]|uniref:Uncharacterized protein n=1 Tax=Leucobacter triazinivorans TaxID=1784719 RepID=A0A4P6KCY0_9MICO|nr:hypothetical protein [Leucobacter triazinivorans]QBE48225.1 hypothetical protein EVS81_04740 [Leucobacter triazinivorans]
MRFAVIGDVPLEEGRRAPGDPLAGGAARVATLLRDDGHEVELLTAVTADGDARRLLQLLAGITVIACSSGIPISREAAVPRRPDSTGACATDPSTRPPLPRVTARMVRAVALAEALVVVDRGHRLADHPELRVAVHRRGLDVPLVWLPHPEGSDPVPSCRLVVPAPGAAIAAAAISERPAVAVEAAEQLQRRSGCRAIAIPLGDGSAMLAELDRAPLRVHGAGASAGGLGDERCRFAAAAATVLARGGELREAVRVAAASTWGAPPAA